MRVTSYELFDVPPRWTFLKLETSDGLVGWGEVSLSRQRKAVHGAVEEFMEEFVLGADPMRIEDHWQRMFRHGRFRGGPVLMAAISGIDMALWDIKGRSQDLPVYEFLGGATRDTVRLYQHVHTKAEIAGEEEGGGVEDLAADARDQVDAGFTALKFTPTEKVRRVDNPAAIEAARKRVGAVREAVGDEVDVALDFHGRVAKPMAKQFAVELEEFRPMFYEEAVTGPEVADNYAELTNHTSVPLATGERRHSRWAFKDLLESGSIDIVQPDLCYVGGISETRRIAAMAESYDVMFAPHCPFGPVSLAASLQVDACTPNAIIQEQIVHRPEYLGFDPLEYVTTPEVFEFEPGGYVDLPDGPGLGIEVNEEFVREMTDETEPTNFQSPQWRHEDGAIAEW
jgi:galactonate dehydratase